MTKVSNEQEFMDNVKAVQFEYVEVANGTRIKFTVPFPVGPNEVVSYQVLRGLCVTGHIMQVAVDFTNEDGESIADLDTADEMFGITETETERALLGLALSIPEDKDVN